MNVKKIGTRLMSAVFAAVMVMGLVPSAAFAAEPQVHIEDYVDVKGHWAEAAIAEVFSRELFRGVSLTTFDPEGTMTRGMFITVLGRMAGVDKDRSAETDFSDVDENKYYAPYIAWAAENGIISASEKTFAPDKAVTRQEMTVFMVNYCRYAKTELKDNGAVKFADADEISDWAKEAVDTASAAGLIIGTDNGCFAPGAAASRAEVATLVVRFMNQYAD